MGADAGPCELGAEALEAERVVTVSLDDAAVTEAGAAVATTLTSPLDLLRFVRG